MADGRFDVAFTEQDRKSVKHQLGLTTIGYFQIFGTYAGTITTASAR